MTDLLFVEDCIQLNSNSDLQLVDANNSLSVNENSIIFTEQDKLSVQVVAENSASVALVETEVFLDFNSVTGSGSMDDAPRNNLLYVRRNGKWLQLNHTTFPSEQDSYLYGRVDTLDDFRIMAIGQGLDVDARYVNIHDLLGMGIIKRNGGGTVIGVDILPTGPVFMTTPPAPLHLRAVSNLGRVDLYWDTAFNLYTNHSTTQIFRSVTSNRNDAVKIFEVPLGYFATDSGALHGTTYYYWIRFVSLAGNIGPFNSLTGTVSGALDDATKVLEVLTGQIGLLQLTDDLREPIELINAEDGIIQKQLELQQSIVDETADRVSALTSEAETRFAQIQDEINNRVDAITSVTTEFTDADTNLKSKIDYVGSVTNGSFDATYAWYFDEDDEDWESDTGTIAFLSGNIRPGFSSNTYLTSPEITLIGSDSSEVRVRIRKVGNPVWEGSLLYVTTIAPSWASPSSLHTVEPEFFDGYCTVAWNLINEPAWTARVIKGIRLQLALNTDSINYYEIDWVSIGRVAPGASIAFVKQEVFVQTTAISAEAALRESLAAQVRGGYTGTDIDSITEGLLFSERAARADADLAISSQMALLSAGSSNQFDQLNIWYFDTTIEGWTGNPTNPTILTPGFIRPADDASAPYVVSPNTLAIDPFKYPQVRVRLRRTGTPTWVGDLYWKRTGDSTWDSGRKTTMAEPSWDGDGFGLLTFNPEWDGVVDQLRLSLTSNQTPSYYIEIDWVAIGRPSPGASSAQLAAEISTRASADSALADSITALTTTVGTKAAQSAVDSLTSRVTTTEGVTTVQGTKLTQIDSQLYPTLLNDNPSMIITNVLDTVPDLWVAVDATGLARYIGIYAYSANSAVQMTCTSTQVTGIKFTCPTYKCSDNDLFLDIELVFTLVSGSSINGAGVVIEFFNTLGAVVRAYVALKSIYLFPSSLIGRRTVCKHRVAIPYVPGILDYVVIKLMGNYDTDATLGPKSTHTIIFDNIKVFVSDVTAQAISILDARVTANEDGITSQSSSIVTLQNQLSLQTNLLNTSIWAPGTSGNQVLDPYFWFGVTGTGVSNSIVSLPGPFNITETMWQSIAGTNAAGDSGGFVTSIPTEDRLPKSRGAVFFGFVKHSVSAAGSNPGVLMWSATPVTTLANVLDGYGRFISTALTNLIIDEWYLLYGVVQPYGATTSDSGIGGVYRLSTGDKIASATEFRADTTWNDGAQYFRGQLSLSNQSGKQLQWARPTVLPLDLAPTPWELMRQDKRLPATATALSTLTSEVHDSVNGLSAVAARTLYLEANVPTEGGNLIPGDTEFLVDVGGWVNCTRDLGGSGFAPYGLHQVGRTSPGTSEDAYSFYSDKIPITAGKRYGYSAYTSNYRCTVLCRLNFYSSTDVYISETSYYANNAPGLTDLANWSFGGKCVVAPANTSYARWVMTVYRDVGQSDPYAFICRPMVAEVGASQTAAPKWAPSTGGALARIAVEESARASADSAIATSVTNVTTTVNGHTSTIATQQTSINGISAQYMVKLDVNGFVSGFGLYNSAGSSSFAVNASNFTVGKPGSTGVYPFIVDTVNNRVAMDGAYIKTASIDSASIANLNANKIVAGTITTDKIVVGAVSARTEVNQGMTSFLLGNTTGYAATLSGTLTFTPSVTQYKVLGGLMVRFYNLPTNIATVSGSAVVIIDNNTTDVNQVAHQVILHTAFTTSSVTKDAITTFTMCAYAKGTKATPVNHTIAYQINFTYKDAAGNVVTGGSAASFAHTSFILIEENKV